MSTPLVSVILPVYNGEDYILEAINSVLKQTLTNFELIIINDGSTDNTLSLLQECASNDSRIQILDIPNSGLIKALNIGLERATGAYIARMDADDVCHKKRLELQVRFLEANKDIIACGTQYKTFGDFEKVISNPINSERFNNKLLFGPQICHPTLLVRSSVISKIKYDCDYFGAEDYKLWVDLSVHGKLSNVNSTLLMYRVHSKQVSSLYREKQVRSHLLCAQKAWSQIKGIHVDFNILKTIIFGTAVNQDINRARKFLSSQSEYIKEYGNYLLVRNNLTKLCYADFFKALKYYLKRKVYSDY